MKQEKWKTWKGDLGIQIRFKNTRKKKAIGKSA
jgi:hypothetical protein